jgi:hypothetical protein
MSQPNARAVGRPVPFGFRFLLVFEDGEPADPPAFLTALPNWKTGDEFLAGPDLVKYRIVAIADDDPPAGFAAIFVVAVA